MDEADGQKLTPPRASPNIYSVRADVRCACGWSSGWCPLDDLAAPDAFADHACEPGGFAFLVAWNDHHPPDPDVVGFVEVAQALLARAEADRQALVARRLRR